MFKHRLTISDYLLIVVNCIPLYGVWFEGWEAKQIFIVYCLETVMIGIINVIKMACITLLVRKKDVWENGNSTSMQSGWFFILFFILHYGFFVFVQSQIFFGVAGLKQTGDLMYPLYQPHLCFKSKAMDICFHGNKRNKFVSNYADTYFSLQVKQTNCSSLL